MGSGGSAASGRGDRGRGGGPAATTAAGLSGALAGRVLRGLGSCMRGWSRQWGHWVTGDPNTGRAGGRGRAPAWSGGSSTEGQQRGRTGRGSSRVAAGTQTGSGRDSGQVAAGSTCGKGIARALSRHPMHVVSTSCTASLGMLHAGQPLAVGSPLHVAGILCSGISPRLNCWLSVA